MLLNRAKKQILLIYSGMGLGMTLSLVLSRFIWIDMRINTSFFLPLSVLVWTGAGGFLKKTPSVLIVVALQTGLGIALIYTCGTDTGAWEVIPAAITRDGLFLKSMNLSIINQILIFLFLTGNAALIFSPKTHKYPHPLD